MPIEPIYPRLGQRIAEERRAQGLTQEEAATQFDMPRALLSKLECGRYRIQLHDLLEVARSLGVGLDRLLRPVARRTTPDAARKAGL